MAKSSKGLKETPREFEPSNDGSNLTPHDFHLNDSEKLNRQEQALLLNRHASHMSTPAQLLKLYQQIYDLFTGNTPMYRRLLTHSAVLVVLASALGCKNPDTSTQVKATHSLDQNVDSIPLTLPKEPEETDQQRKERILKEMIIQAMQSPESWQSKKTSYYKHYPYHLLQVTAETLEKKDLKAKSAPPPAGNVATAPTSPTIEEETLQALIEDMSFADRENLNIKIPDLNGNYKVFIETFLGTIKLWHKEPYAERSILRFAKNFPLETLEHFEQINGYFSETTRVQVAYNIIQACPVEGNKAVKKITEYFAPPQSLMITNTAYKAAQGAKPCK